MTLYEHEQHFSAVYGRRNALFLRGIGERIDLLSIGVSDLQDAVRRGRRHDLLSIALARLVSRVFCVVDHFRGGLDLTAAMEEKFPASGCSYCHHLPCQCGDDSRPEATLAAASSDDQRAWSLQRWADHMDAVYGPRNRAKGFEHVITRLFREVEELRVVTLRLPWMDQPADAILHEHALELADVLSWIMTASNVLGVKLGEAVDGRYAGGCTTCHAMLCQCRHFYRMQIDWERLLEQPAIDIDTSSQSLPRG